MRNVSGSVHDYGRDGWLGPVCVQLFPSIFLSDERGERQHTVICCDATADNSKSPAQSHLPSSKMARGGSCQGRKGKNVVNLFGNAPADNHMSHATVEPTTQGRAYFTLTYSLEWIIEAGAQNRATLLFFWFIFKSHNQMWQSKQKHWQFNLAQNFPRGHRSPLREKVFSLFWHFQIKFIKTSFFFISDFLYPKLQDWLRFKMTDQAR